MRPLFYLILTLASFHKQCKPLVQLFHRLLILFKIIRLSYVVIPNTCGASQALLGVTLQPQQQSIPLLFLYVLH